MRTAYFGLGFVGGHDFSRAVRVLMRTAYFGLGFVGGHDFSRAVRVLIRTGFSHCGHCLRDWPGKSDSMASPQDEDPAAGQEWGHPLEIWAARLETRIAKK